MSDSMANVIDFDFGRASFSKQVTKLFFEQGAVSAPSNRVWLGQYEDEDFMMCIKEAKTESVGKKANLFIRVSSSEAEVIRGALERCGIHINMWGQPPAWLLKQ